VSSPAPAIEVLRRSVMDLFEAALDGDRQYRGKAALPAVFDAKLLLDGIENEDGKLPDFEYLSTEGPTREYLQRPVRQKLYPWKDMGTYPFTELPHQGWSLTVRLLRRAWHRRPLFGPPLAS
jgi:hypothetical protein